jgi:protein tyrosine phosphatase (PTP) superfamily phosphohydrolase (DUF442 family)
MPFNKILNTILVTENIATSGQPLPDQFQFIADTGYQKSIQKLPDTEIVTMIGS